MSATEAPSKTKTVRRYDQTEPIGAITKTAAGGRRVAANLSRVGVFRYQYGDGSVVREYRPPQAVLAPEALASFRGAPVTWLHPDGGVSPANFREVVRGHVFSVDVAAPFMVGALDIDDAELIAKIDSGEFRELSCGYTADCDPTPGVTPDGEEYDAIQTNIRGNHVAGGPEGWGRQGPTVALRSDSGSAIGISVATATASTTENKTMAKIKVDGIEYEAGSDSHLSALDKLHTTLVKRADNADAALTAERTKLAAETKRADDAAALAATEKKRADDAAALAAPAALAARVNERVRLITSARRALGAKYLDDAAAQAAASDDDIIKAVLAKLAPSLDASTMDHAMLMGALLALCSQAVGDEMTEPPMDSAGDKLPPPGPPALEPGLGAYDSKFAPRGKIGERVESPNLPNGSNGNEKTQAQALAERKRADAERWKKPLTSSAPGR